jgi:microcompartment protein CcmL/EutN
VAAARGEGGRRADARPAEAAGATRGRGGEAIALVELSSIAQGLVVCDAMVKMAYVELFESRPFSSGKYLVLIGGDVASVESSLEKGRIAAGEWLVDHLFIPNVHEGVFPAIRGTAAKAPVDALGAIESRSVAATVIAADAAAKAADVRLIEARLGQGIGGKGYFTLTGSVASVEAAIDAGAAAIAASGQMIRKVVIPAPHDEMLGRIF